MSMLRVKTGTIDPDFKDMDLSGFTGYLEDEPDNDNLVCIIVFYLIHPHYLN